MDWRLASGIKPFYVLHTRLENRIYSFVLNGVFVLIAS